MKMSEEDIAGVITEKLKGEVTKFKILSIKKRWLRRDSYKVKVELDDGTVKTFVLDKKLRDSIDVQNFIDDLRWKVKLYLQERNQRVFMRNSIKELEGKWFELNKRNEWKILDILKDSQ
jgi:hypothetical protein